MIGAPFRSRHSAVALPCWPFAIDLSAASTEAMRAYWPMRPGPEAVELTGTHDDAMLVGAVTTLGQNDALVYRFSGTTGYVNLGRIGTSVANAMITAPSTVSMWFSVNSPVTGSLNRLCGVTNSGNTTAHTVNLRRDADGDLDIFLRDDGSTVTRQWYTVNTPRIDDGLARLLTVVRTAANTTAIYLDGLPASVTAQDIDTIDASVGFDLDYFLGASSLSGGPVGTADTSIWDFRVHDAAFSEDQVYALWDPVTRWSHCAEYGRRTWFIPAAGGGGAVDLAGISQSESAHSAALAVARSFAAVLLSESAANAALAVVRAYAGSLISESEASATFSVLRALAGDAISVSDLSAALTVEGVSAVTFAGISASESLSSGELAALRALLGTSASDSALSASLTVEGASEVVFAGQSLSESVISAALAVLRDIAGTSTSDTDASAAAAVLRALVGQSISESLLSGSLSRAAQSAFAGLLASESFLSGSLITDAVAIATALQRVIAIRADDRTITVH